MSGSVNSINLGNRFSRSARKNSKRAVKRAPPVSIRFSDEQRTVLQEHAGEEALGPYIKRFVLNHHGTNRRRRRSSPSKQKQAIARTLRGLGCSGVLGVLGSFLLAFEEGRLPLNRNEERELRRAAAAVESMRNDLVAALGLREDGGAL